MNKMYCLTGILLMLISVVPASGQSPAFSHQIAYQGRITNPSGEPVADNDYQLTFRIYDDLSGGFLLWEEIHPAVSVADGLFYVYLGSYNPIIMDSLSKGSPYVPVPLYLETQVGSDPPIDPRTLLGGMPYSAVTERIKGDVESSPGKLLVTNPFEKGPDSARVIIDNGRAVVDVWKVDDINDIDIRSVQFADAFETGTTDAWSFSAQYDTLSGKGKVKVRKVDENNAELNPDTLKFEGLNGDTARYNRNKAEIIGISGDKVELTPGEGLKCDDNAGSHAEYRPDKLTIENATNNALVKADSVSLESPSGSIKIGVGTAIAINLTDASSTASISGGAVVVGDSPGLSASWAADEASMEDGAGNSVNLTPAGGLKCDDSGGDHAELDTDRMALEASDGRLTEATQDGVKVTNGDIAAEKKVEIKPDSIGLESPGGSIGLGVGTAIAINVTSPSSTASIGSNGIVTFGGSLTLSATNEKVELTDSDGINNYRLNADPYGLLVEYESPTLVDRIHLEGGGGGGGSLIFGRSTDVQPVEVEMIELGLVSTGPRLAFRSNEADPLDEADCDYEYDPLNRLIKTCRANSAQGNDSSVTTAEGIHYYNDPWEHIYDYKGIEFIDGLSGTSTFSVNSNGAIYAYGDVGLALNPTSRVGIGTDIPSATLHVAGDICYTGSIGACSDARYKKDIVALSGALEKVCRLRGISFNWRCDEFPENRFSDEEQVGLVAQEVKEVFPQVVSQTDNGYYNIDYAKLTPLLVEAIKELKVQNEELKASNEELLQRIEKIENGR